MSKKSKKNARQPKPKRKGGGDTRAAVQRFRGNLDAAAIAYARLLADPCGAPLTRSIGYGTGSSIVVRTEADALYFSGATDQGGWLLWCPPTTVCCSVTTSTDTGLASGNTTNFTSVAGRGLSSVASSIRCVAACLQVMWPGTENNRQGFVGVGVVPASVLSRYLPASSGGQAITLSGAQARALCQHTERVPDTMTEITWRPGPEDDTDYDLGVSGATATQFAGNIGSRNCILLAVAGLPVSTGLRVRTVGVFEYSPLEGSGFAASVETPRSFNNQGEVLQALDATDGRWWLNGFKRLGSQALTRVASYGFKRAEQAIMGGVTQAGAIAARAAPLLLTM